MANLLVSRRDGHLILSVDLARRRKLTIGRSGRCDLHLDAPAVSRRHALLVLWGRTWVIIDTASTTGIMVPAEEEGAETRVQTAELTEDAWIRIGPSFLWLEGSVGRSARAPTVAPAVEGEEADASMPVLRVFDLTGRPVHALALADVDVVTVGRASPCDLVIADESLSRLHAVVYREGDRWCIVDADSSSGTRVDGKRARRRRLADHTLVRIGAHLLQISGGASSAESEAESVSALFALPREGSESLAAVRPLST